MAASSPNMKRREATIYAEEYQRLIAYLVKFRKSQGLTQADVAAKVGLPQYDISKVESCVRRLDVLELNDWLKALGVKSSLIKSIKQLIEA